jgi:uncharacterized protein (DUF2336 family)
LPQPAYTEPASALALSPEDVERLLKDTSASARIDMTGKIGTAYNGSELTPNEIKIAEQIFRLLLRDTEVKVRASLAEHVKDSLSIPRDIVMTLAKDVEEVSLPVLQFSEVLSDNDLLEIINNTPQISRHLAISRRKAVSDVVSDTLVEKGNTEVTSSLVANDGAAISEAAFEKIFDNYKGNMSMLESLTKRAYLPVVMAEKLVTVVSGALASTLKQKYQLTTGQIEHEADKTREKETLSLVRHARDDDDVDKLLMQLQNSGRLTPSIILSGLCQGNFEFFENALARLSGIPVANARKLITDKGELGFRAIYNKSGLPDAMFPAVKLLLKIVHDLDNEGERPGTARYANRIVERILQASEDRELENLSYIIALVRRVAQ